jgi:aromatic ring-opening dioxygenase catalytic subunit (LigB family)
MLTSRVLLVPSVPTLLIEEQRGNMTAMIGALIAAGESLLAELPHAIVAVSARWRNEGPFQADDSRRLQTLIDLPGWGVEPRYDCAGHPKLARALVAAANRRELRAVAAYRGVDTGLSIPLHFLSRNRTIPIVPVSLSSTASREEHRRWGEAIRDVLDAWKDPVAFIVGGALTFNQHAFNLKRTMVESLDVDEYVIAALQRGAWSEVFHFPSGITERAMPEADLMHLEVLRGFLRADLSAELLAYENAPGIGTALMEIPLAAVASS